MEGIGCVYFLLVLHIYFRFVNAVKLRRRSGYFYYRGSSLEFAAVHVKTLCRGYIRSVHRKLVFPRIYFIKHYVYLRRLDFSHLKINLGILAFNAYL